MKSKKILVLLLLPLAFGVVLTDSVQAKSNKIRMRMTGCLQPGTTPDTFVLSNITKGYTHRNQTGMAPQALARTDDFVLVPERGKVDLQKHVGQKVKVKGWITGERSDTYTATDAYGNQTTATVNTSDFHITDVDRISGSCP